MATRISNASARGSLDTLTALLNGGVLEIRTGSQPADGPDGTATGSVLATLTLGNPAFNPAVDANGLAEAVANAITGDASADQTGSAGWFRGYSSGATPAVVDGSITGVGGGGDMEMNTTQVVLGGPVDVASWVIRLPEGPGS